MTTTTTTTTRRNQSSLAQPKIARLEMYPLADSDELLDWVERDCGRAVQAMHDLWLTRHLRRGTPALYRAHEPTGACVPLDWNRDLAEAGKNAAPSLNRHMVDFLLQWWRGTLTKKESASKHRKAWCAILTGDEAAPQFQRLPPRINAAFASLAMNEQGKLILSAKLAYAQGNGGRLLVHRWELRPAKEPTSRRARKSAQKARRWANYQLALQVAAGERHLATSQIVRKVRKPIRDDDDEEEREDKCPWRRVKTYLMLTVEGAEPPVKPSTNKTAVVRPGATMPLELWVGGKLAGSWGEEFVPLLAAKRQALLAARPAKTRKHDLALRHYRNLCDTICQTLSRRVVDAICAARCGAITLDDGVDAESILVRAGVAKDDVAKFPLEALRKLVKQKLARRGLSVADERKTRSGKARIANRRKQLTKDQVRGVAK